MLSRWLDTLRNGLERMNFRMHRFNIIERSTDSSGTITSSSMHSMPSLAVLALSDKLQTRGHDPFFLSFFLLAHLGYFFRMKRFLRANVSLASFCTMINIVRRYEIFFQRVSQENRTRGQKIQTLAFEVNNNRSEQNSTKIKFKNSTFNLVRITVIIGLFETFFFS